MRIVIRTMQDPTREIDLTHRLTAAIAEELWRLFGGNEHLNWLEAEMQLAKIVESIRSTVSREAIGEAREAGRDEARREVNDPHQELLMIERMGNGARGETSGEHGDADGTRQLAESPPGQTLRRSHRAARSRRNRGRIIEPIGAT